MYIKLANGRIYDPVHGINGEQRDIYIHDGIITRKPSSNTKISKVYDLKGKIIMAGAIDIHTHIGGGKVNIARMMLPEDHQKDLVEKTALTRSGCGHAAPSTLTAGYRYAEMGYTACFEPAMLPSNARQTHMEMADTPMVDKGAYAMLGSDDFFLRMLSAKKDQAAISDYVGWIINATKAMAIKVVNPGGINAFKFNQRELDLDEVNQHYGVSPRQILLSLIRAVTELGVPHPLHVHGCNLGVPGNVNTTLETIWATEGMRMHLTHIQFHSYGVEGDKKFSSGAAEIAEAINKNPNITCDVGQILFNQTVTASGDSLHQYAGHWHAHPKKWVVMDIECDAGCGVVPFKYRDKNFVNALQWAIGLELFLLIDDPWRIFLTTDHPNGAPFTSYPHLIRLLMDKSFRNDMLSSINKEAASASTLGSIDREYSLYEIAIMTRAAPARSLGLKNRGHLGSGAIADITVYSEHKNKERMFSQPDYVFKDGEVIVRNGKITKVINGGTHILRPGFDKGIEKSLRRYFEDYQTMSLGNFKIDDDEIVEHGNSKLIVQPCS
ncbi:MAG: formylmethanofuran dehydrogenase subunit A [Pseudomonadota bacterium]